MPLRWYDSRLACRIKGALGSPETDILLFDCYFYFSATTAAAADDQSDGRDADAHDEQEDSGARMTCYLLYLFPVLYLPIPSLGPEPNLRHLGLTDFSLPVALQGLKVHMPGASDANPAGQWDTCRYLNPKSM